MAGTSGGASFAPLLCSISPESAVSSRTGSERRTYWSKRSLRSKGDECRSAAGRTYRSNRANGALDQHAPDWLVRFEEVAAQRESAEVCPPPRLRLWHRLNSGGWPRGVPGSRNCGASRPPKRPARATTRGSGPATGMPQCSSWTSTWRRPRLAAGHSSICSRSTGSRASLEPTMPVPLAATPPVRPSWL
jgi:hypothetical protein